jgi:4-hydroxybenzoate polyprenyltransferase
MKAAAYVSLTVFLLSFAVLVLQALYDFTHLSPVSSFEYAYFGFVAVAALITALALFGSAKGGR